MKQILIAYQNSQTQLTDRMEQIREQLKHVSRTDPESSALEARRRMLAEEIYEQQQIIERLGDYLEQTDDAESGDGRCG